MELRKSVVVALVLACSGCGSTTPTKETITSYSIYDVRGPSSVSPAAVAEAVTNGLKQSSSSIQVTRNLPPYPVPDQPGRFTVTNPFANTQMGALAQAAGSNFNVAKCDNAFVVGSAVNSGMREYGENTQFYVCLWQYKEGYHLDFYVKFDRQSGGFSTKTLAATLMRPLTGDSSQFIPRTIGNVTAEIEKIGLKPTLADSFPSQN